VVLAGLVVTGCADSPGRTEAGDAPPPAAETWIPGTDAYAARDAVVAAMRGAGGVHVVVTGRPSETDVDLVYDAEHQRFARRFEWSEQGTPRELLELGTGRVCANRAAAEALEASSNSAMGYLEASDRAYTCTSRRDGLGGFVVYGYAALDAVGRLSGLMGDLTMSDLGAETGEDGTTTRHLRISAAESDRSLRTLPTTYDLWVAADQRLVRAEFTSLDQDHGPYAATFEYDDVDEVSLPADRGAFVVHGGTGPPGSR
jgi:hypothetical protein